MAKVTGKIQVVFKSTDKLSEKNVVQSFSGIFSLLKFIYKIRKAGAYSVYIFFDNIKFFTKTNQS